MKAKTIFINEREFNATGNQYALASGVCSDQFDSVYLRLDDVVDFIQSMQNAEAEEMIKMQEQANGEVVAPIGNQAAWRAYNFLLSELKRFITNK